ncbi:PREDICTED: uncharacterized protein LOC109157030 [Ipomoea nil]|uniref:uncharacterized protein LOC109157030 n=1 Tax=Ipomoea nil TaxID=35883 RepID=UPI0009009A9A|nr:PREDICTED: uncharacterized protein LOC109157030 [Ipomoea nil]
MTTCNDKLWVCVMNEKYVKNGNFFTAPNPRKSSWCWRSIIRWWSTIELGSAWRVGNGRTLNFLSDWSVADKPLGFLEDIEITDEVANAKVCDFILPKHSWDFDRLSNFLPSDLVNSIRTIPIPCNDQAQDVLYWPGSSSGMFSVQEGFKFILGAGVGTVQIVYLAFNEWGLADDSGYSACGKDDESIGHILMDCDIAKAIWRRTYHPSYFRYGIPQGVTSWLKTNCSSKLSMKWNLWQTTFAYTCWVLWKARNRRVFGQKPCSFSSNSHQVADLTEATMATMTWKNLGDKDRNAWISWHQSNEGFFAELWGLRKGLRLAKARGVNRVIFELDSESVVAVMRDTDEDMTNASILINDCKFLAKHFDDIIFQHTLREGNKCADHLANIGQTTD